MSLCVASSIIEGKNTKYKKRTIKIIGTLYYYVHLSKKFIKQCCFNKYYIAHYNEQIIQSLLQLRSPKNQKFLHLDASFTPVFELQYNEYEKLYKDPFSYPEINSKLDIIRNIKLEPIQKEYEIITSHMLQKRTCHQHMEIDSYSLHDDAIQNVLHYMYIIKDRTAIETGKNIYKIGKTKQENLKRFRGYPKGFKIILLLACSNCDVIEKHIIQLFKKKYVQIKEYGNEYFQGNINEMIQDITNLIL